MAGSERPFALDAPLGPWRALDGWVAGYALLTLGVAAAGALRGVPGCPAQALLSLAILAVALGLAWATRTTASRVLLVLRLFYAPMLYWAFYHQIQTLWPVLRDAPLDGPLAALEARLWGFQPALAFRPALPNRWLSELFCFAYFSYYAFIPVLGFTVLVRRGYGAAERILRSATALFYACYTFFWLAPTVGPHYWFPPGRGPELAQGYVFNHLLYLPHLRGGDPRRRLPLLPPGGGPAPDPARPARRAGPVPGHGGDHRADDAGGGVPAGPLCPGRARGPAGGMGGLPRFPPGPARKADRGGMIAQDRNRSGARPHHHPCEAPCPPALPTP